MGWMERRTPPGDAGFTLAGLLIVMTIMMIFVAYTVPRQWSNVMQRERERQTIFIMKQYAKAIHEFSRKNGNALPASMDQLKSAKLPRFMRPKDGEYADPLTGQVDWLIIPASAAQGQQIGPAGSGPGSSTSTTTTTTGTGTTSSGSTDSAGAVPTIPAIPLKDYAGGPFIGVRPGKTGKSMLELNGMQNYEQWSYTVTDYRNEVTARMATAAKLWQ